MANLMEHGLIGFQMGRKERKEIQLVVIALACQLWKMESGLIGMKMDK